MSGTPLIIKGISVYKLPGFPRGMEAMDGFARHINIIAGPNGSGKTSTARLIRHLLWQQQLGRLHADMSLDIGGLGWEIKADSGHYQCITAGQPATLSLPAADESKRYLLALHELITDNDHDLAALLIREASGGYDLPAAQSKLGYDSRIKGRGIGELTRYNEAKAKIALIEISQQQLKSKEDSLQRLKKERQDAADATGHHDLYQCLIASLTAHADLNKLKLLLDDCPSQLSLLTGEEYTRIEMLETNQGLNDQAIINISDIIKRKNDRLSELGLPREGINKALLGELQNRVDRLADQEKKIAELKNDITGAALTADKALKLLSPDLKGSDIQPLDLTSITGLSKFMEGTHRLLSEKQFLEVVIELLNKEQPVDAGDQAKVRDATSTLLLWLQERSPAQGIPAWSLWALILTGAVSALLTLLLGWIGLTGIIAMLLIAFFAARQKAGDEGDTRKKDFRKTGLREPAEWNTEAVEARLEELNIEYQEVKRADLLAVQIAAQQSELANLEDRLAKMDSQRDEWLETVGVLPEIKQDELKDYSGLYWFLSNLLAWQESFATMKALELQEEITLSQQTERLSEINTLIKDLAPAVKDAAEAKGILIKLQADETERALLAQEISGLEAQLADKERTAENLKNEMLTIYDKFSLEPGQKQEFWQWNGQLEAYNKLKTTHQEADVLSRDKKHILVAHRLFSMVEAALDTVTLEDAKQKCGDFEKQSARFEALNKEIIEIERDIQTTRNSKALEESLAVKNAALDGLEQVYENNLSAITGSLLVSLLKETYREQNTEGIYGRSNQRFSRITNGRYELNFGDGVSPTLKAYDTVYKNWLELSELSTGTRIQLLLAVRLSFIELQEQGLKLPILADEVLANSDDLRAKEIISALVQISKEGRQVFYFTAQDDEIDKWKAFSSTDPDLDFKIFTLDGHQNASINYRTSGAAATPSFKINSIPRPSNTDTVAYGALLKVPPFQMPSENPEQLHLWYVLEDNDLLYACLSMGISRFGALKRLMLQGVTINGMTTDIWAGIQLKIKLLTSYIDLQRRGKGKPIDRQTLLASGAVGPSFIEKVAELLKELNSDPVILLAALRTKAVTGFLQNKIAALEQYLTEQNIIDDRAPLSDEDMRERMIAIISNLDILLGDAEAFLIKVTAIK